MEFISLDVLELLRGLSNAWMAKAGVFLIDAQALCAIFMLIYMGLQGYGMLSGDKQLEVLPLLRPFALAMVLFFWQDFVDLMGVPGALIADHAESSFEKELAVVDALQQERSQKMAQIANKMFEDAAELEEFDTSNDDGFFSQLGVDFGAIFDQIKGYYVIITSKIRWVLMEILEFIVVGFFKACSYLIFFLQTLFTTILATLGPFAFAFSVLPAFRDSYVTWIARFISVTLYSGIAFVIMDLSMTFINFGLQKELVVIDEVLKNEALFFTYISGNNAGAYYYLIPTLVGSAAMLTVPVISTWMINTSGVGHAVSTTMKAGAKEVAGFIKA